MNLMQWVESVNQLVNDLVWGVPAMVCILGVGLYLVFSTKGIQFRKFGYAMKSVLGRMFQKRQASDGSITPFQAVCTALAATVGTGNIAGVAGAIAIGGPGAVFWMWVSALLGMGTKLAEVVLAVHFRERSPSGELVGGPMYYIKNGLGKKWMWLAYLYAIFGLGSVVGTGVTTQVNTIAAAINTTLLQFDLLSAQSVETSNLIIGLVLAGVVALILLGGIKRIGSVAEQLVPIMAVLYIVLGLGVIVLRFQGIPAVVASIFIGAFQPRAVTGGIVGSFLLSMRSGIARGIFSNEAGLGSGSIAHACADTNNPVQQGMFGIFEVFVDTIVICTMTALVVLLGAPSIVYGQTAGAELTISGFTSAYGGWVSIFTAVALCCFAFSTILGWGLYGERFVEFIFGSKAIPWFYVIYSLLSIAGATLEMGFIWSMAETFNGLMSIPNLLALFLLTPVLVKLIRQYGFMKSK